MTEGDRSDEDLQSLTRAQLRELAREADIPRSSSLVKSDLIEHLTLDRRWRVLKFEVLLDEARRHGITELQDVDKAGLIRELHRAHQSAPLPAPEPDTVVGEAAGVARPRAGPSPALGRALRGAGFIGMAVLLTTAVALPIGSILISPRIEGQLSDLSRSLGEASELLYASSLALEAASDALDATTRGLETTQTTLADSQPMLDSVSDLLGDQAPNTIESTRSALAGAQDGARAMDRVLRGLALFGLDYNPELPLDESLAMTADSLEPLPGALLGVQEDLDLVAGDLQALEHSLGRVKGDISILSRAVRPMGEDLGIQANNLGQLSGQLDQAGQGVRTWIIGFGILGSLTALWGALVHVPLVVLGGWLQSGMPSDREH